MDTQAHPLYNAFIEGHSGDHLDSLGRDDSEERAACPFCRLALALHSRHPRIVAILEERDSRGRYLNGPETIAYASSISWCMKTAAPGMLRHEPGLATRILALDLNA